MVLYAAIRQHGAPEALVSDGGAVFKAKQALEVYAALGIVKEQIDQGQAWQSYIELVYQPRFATRQEARRAIFEYGEVFYNRKRRHSALGYLSPVAFEERQRAQPLIAQAA